MARIRSVKPEFFKHFELNELENAHSELRIMLVYEGLWTQCDKNGVFIYNAKVLKNEILPYVDFDMQKSLDILEKEGYFSRFKHEKREYGYISKFNKYQFPTKQEKESPAKYPLPPTDSIDDISETNTDDTTNVTDNVTDNVTNNVTDNVTDPEGIWNLEEGIQEKGERKKDSCDSDFSEPKNLFLHVWQHTPDVFNAMARIESLHEWDNFWEKSGVTCEQVKTALENFIADVKTGAIEMRYVPSLPDRFVLKGWITKCQQRFPPKNTAPPHGRSPPGKSPPKKSLLL